MYSQYKPGPCTRFGIDSFETRLGALETCMKYLDYDFDGMKIGLPLVASGIAADPILKGSMTDLQYFKKYLSRSLSKFTNNEITIVYL